MAITFTYANVRIDNDPANLWTVDLDLTLDGDTYQVTLEWNEDPDMGRSLDVTLEGHDQYWGPSSDPFGAGAVENITHFSRTFDSYELKEWMETTFLDPIWNAQRKAIAAMQGAEDVVTWEQ